jgi:hypothetical protein
MRGPDTQGIVSSEKSLERLELEPGKYVPFFKHKKKLYMRTETSEEGYPVYDKIDMINNRDFNTYSFRGIEKGLEVDSIEYISATEKLFKDKANVIDENSTQQDIECKSNN